MRIRLWLTLPLIGLAGLPGRGDEPTFRITQTPDFIQIDTDALSAVVRKRGYVSGVAQGHFLDRKTGANELGFGLHIMDFLLAPGWRDDGYLRDPMIHGHLPKHYVEGPQICTQAKQLDADVIQGSDFVAVKLRCRYREAAPGLKPGSLWEQTLVFLPGKRYFLSGEQITSANTVDNVFYRLDMPGHVRHKGGDTFSQVYLSYHGMIPASAFAENFAPDARFLYQRQEGHIPGRMIRAYQVKRDGQPGPWLAGMTLNPAAVSEAWCHQRGYVCFIEELHGRPVKAGETFGAAYVVGWFDDLPDMERTYDRYKGKRKLTARSDGYSLE